MLDPNTITFQSTDEGHLRALVGQLGAMQAITIDLRELPDDANEKIVMERARQALLIMLWRQIYGQLGGIVEHCYRIAKEAGDLRYLSPLEDARKLLRPAVPTLAHGEGIPPGEGTAETPRRGEDPLAEKVANEHAEALRGICLLFGFDPSDGEGTSGEEVRTMVQSFIRETLGAINVCESAIGLLRTLVPFDTACGAGALYAISKLREQIPNLAI